MTEGSESENETKNCKRVKALTEEFGHNGLL
jgi:hypothetical protein